VVVANLDFNYTHAGWVTLDLDSMGLEPGHPYQVHELIGESRHLWNGARNYVELDPKSFPVHVLRIRRKLRTERDFDYFL
jgi:starch synthase (maltosyl-transferring)